MTWSESLLKRTHDALNTNPSNANRRLTNGGSNWLWAVFAMFALSFLAWLIWSFVLKAPGHVKAAKHGKHDAAVDNGATTTTSTTHGTHGTHGATGAHQPNAERIFHYLWTIAAFAGMVAYFSMASNLGNTPIRQYLRHGNNPFQTRQIFYARYIYWFIAWPMVVTAILLLSGVSWATLLFAVAMVELWIVSWLAGALVHTKYKWGFYVFGIAAYCVLAAILLLWGRKHSTRLNTAAKNYTPLAAALVGIWLLYWVAWGLSEGGNYLSVTHEHIFYGILDLISVPLLGFAFLALSRKWDHQALGLHYTQGRVNGYGHGGFGHGGYGNNHYDNGYGNNGHHASLAEKGALGAGAGLAAHEAGNHHHNNGIGHNNGVLGHDNMTTTTSTGLGHNHGTGHGVAGHDHNGIIPGTQTSTAPLAGTHEGVGHNSTTHMA